MVPTARYILAQYPHAETIPMKHAEIIGLTGFTTSGVLFVISALRSGDMLALAGSIVWVVSCLVWMIALRPPK